MSKKMAQRRWRESHPVLSAWHVHISNAKRRGIQILWTFTEFAQFCEETGYHLLRKDGYQIHRHGDIGPYEYKRVSMVKSEINRWAQDIYRKSRIMRAS